MNEKDAKKRRVIIGIREKILIIATIIVLVILSIKSIKYDAYEPKDTDDVVAIERFIELHYDSIFYDSGFFKIRIINYNNSEEEKKLHLRKYLFGIVPIGDVYTFME